MFLFRIFVLCFVIFVSDAKNEDYKGNRIYKVHFKTEEQFEKLDSLKSDIVDFLKRPSLKYAIDGLAMVPPSHFLWFEEKLEQLDIDINIFEEDVYQYLKEKDKQSETFYRNEDNGAFDFNHYYRYDVILNHARSYEERYQNSNLNVEAVEFGLTEEGRELMYLKLSRVNETEDKPVVIIEAGINPREWITVPAALNVLDKVIEEDGLLLNEYDWIVVPVVNPDGYEYTHTNLRLWQKNRSTNTNLGMICPGVNINRNFDISWRISDSSTSACSHLFAGLEPESEIETKLLKNLLEQYGDRIRLYISLQNNGGVISYPWLYEYAASGMFRQHHLLGLDMIEAMTEEYKLDTGSLAFDRISGTSADYFRQSGVLYTYNIDIIDKGDSVVIPEEDIVDIVEDVWRAIAVAARSII